MEFIQYVVFCIWLLWLSMTFLRPLHTVMWVSASFLWQNYIPSYGYIIYCLTLHSLMDVWLIVSIASVTMYLSIGCPVLLVYTQEWDYYILWWFCVLNFWGVIRLFSSVATLFYIPTGNIQWFQLLTFLPTLYFLNKSTQFFFLKIYLFIAAPGLYCCVWAFSSCREWGLLSCC